MRRTVFTFLTLLAGIAGTDAQSVSKSYSYFSIGGRTLEEIDSELSKRGPQVKSTGRRHPGATQMRFSTRITYANTGRWCAVDKAEVTVSAKIILPRWGQRASADGDTRLVWDTLSADIRRHEEQHVLIAKRHARELEHALEGLDRRRDCDLVKTDAAQTSERILEEHDRAQAQFDRAEGVNFENRLMRLLAYRLERMEREKRK